MRCFYSVNVRFTAHRWLVHLTRAQLLSFMFVAVIQRETIWRGKSSEASGQRNWLVLNSSWVQGHKKRTALVESFPNFLLVLFLPDCPSPLQDGGLSLGELTECWCADEQELSSALRTEPSTERFWDSFSFLNFAYWLIVGPDVIWFC